jgi:hypothetical protein
LLALGLLPYWLLVGELAPREAAKTVETGL